MLQHQAADDRVPVHMLPTVCNLSWPSMFPFRAIEKFNSAVGISKQLRAVVVSVLLEKFSPLTFTAKVTKANLQMPEVVLERVSSSEYPKTRFSLSDSVFFAAADAEGLLLDVLSDEKGISLQRFQALILNLTFGFWFIYTVLENLAFSASPLNTIMPEIENNNLILLGFSSATFAAFKSSGNRVLAALKGSDKNGKE